MTTNREQGEKLLKETEWIFEKDLKTAVDEANYNIAVRRAQEVVELTIKGCLRILGIDFPKVHDAVSYTMNWCQNTGPRSRVSATFG